MLPPEDAEGYNDQQGDMFDAQKDMAHAMLNPIIEAFIYLFAFFKQKP